MTAPFRAWPYAAKAVIQFEFLTDRVAFYIIFRHPMDQDVIPALGSWIFRVDGVDKTPAFTSWKDEYTLGLTVLNIPVHPARILCTYLGPLDTLRTTWLKQWEPWFRILCLDVPYGWEHILEVDVTNTRVTINGQFLLSTTTLTAGLNQVLQVDGINIVFFDCSAGDISVSGFTGGEEGQVLYLAKLTSHANEVKLKHRDLDIWQPINLHSEVDEKLAGQYGGWILVCNGSQWFDLSHEKHI